MKLRWERIGSSRGHVGIYDDDRKGLSKLLAMIPAGWEHDKGELAQALIESIECTGSALGYGSLK